ncbi:hypothetical protein R5H30_00845 [Sulfitobacter sp. D35]|uniref:hypothetical protein n=1 Tax=Sulfitobacter sp. D35 TaxID=3083252 RepID=UPI00296F55B9|nr:hypothetical protein [Sulfitobacter sp. D35]MDW4496511.1 hypothetical protein [Sulfitobacter sp. D35]
MRRRAAPLFALGLLAALAACDAPDIDPVITPASAAADYPDLVPIEPLIAEIEAEQIDAPATQGALESRVAGLQSRADALRGAGIDEAERARLQRVPD